MAIDCAFYCQKCEYNEEFSFIGSTRITLKRGQPENWLVSCVACAKLYVNGFKQCKYCLRTEVPHFTIFKKVLISFPSDDSINHPITFSQNASKKIPCPKCGHQFLTPQISCFYD